MHGIRYAHARRAKAEEPQKRLRAEFAVDADIISARAEPLLEGFNGFYRHCAVSAGRPVAKIAELAKADLDTDDHFAGRAIGIDHCRSRVVFVRQSGFIGFGSIGRRRGIGRIERLLGIFKRGGLVRRGLIERRSGEQKRLCKSQHKQYPGCYSLFRHRTPPVYIS